MTKREHLIDKAVVFGVGLGFMAVTVGAEIVWRHFIGVEDWLLLPLLIISLVLFSRIRSVKRTPLIKGLSILGYLFLFGIVTLLFWWSLAQ